MVHIPGGTVDIAVHEVLTAGHLKEIACGSGGNWGGTEVDKIFIGLIMKILDKRFVEYFEKTCAPNWLDFMLQFEFKKKLGNSATQIILDITYEMAEKYKEITGLNIKDTIQEKSYMGISFNNGKIILSTDVVLKLYSPVIENIKSHIQYQLNNQPQLAQLDYFLLVGGFAESTLLYEILKSTFSTVAPVISPSEAGLAIIKGAVTYGLNPKTIVERIARKTYGKTVLLPYNSEKHDSKKKFWHEEMKEYYCDDVFLKLIEKGQSIKADEVKTFYSSPLYRTHTGATTQIFASNRIDIVHTDEPGVEKIGHLSIDMPLSSSERTIETKVHFGLTEIDVSFSDISIKDGETVKCAIDFLAK